MVLCLGSKSITAVAAFMALMATVLALSANAESVVGDCGSENNCGEILMLEDFAGPKHKWVEMNDPG